jgi:hypothetical protein
VSRTAPRRRATLVAALTVTVLLLAYAAAAHAAVWTVGPTGEVYPFSKPLAAHSIEMYAAGNEYESSQIALRGHAESVTLSWAPDSDPLLTRNSSLFHVGYVVTKRGSMREHLRVGAYPDPLLPATFGKAVAIGSASTSFFVLLHVPQDTAAGTYTGAIDVAEPGGVTSVPVSVQVFSFGWARLSMHTSLRLNTNVIGKSLRGALPWNNATQSIVLPKYYLFWAQHGVSPTVLQPLPTSPRRASPPRTTWPAGSPPGSTAAASTGRVSSTRSSRCACTSPSTTGPPTAARSKRTSPTWCAFTAPTAGAAEPTPTSSTSPANRGRSAWPRRSPRLSTPARPRPATASPS